MYWVGQKSKPAYFCYRPNLNLFTASRFPSFFVYIHHEKFATAGYIVSPSNTICATALPAWAPLPCKILIMTLAIFVGLHCWLGLLLIITNTKKICTFDEIHVKKRHNIKLQHIIELVSMVIKDLLLLLHECPLLSRIAWNQSLRYVGLGYTAPQKTDAIC